ncbi:MAG TPA: LysM peptidoglycan-binding domain-containing protein [Jatrophihabitans sp.]|jgi:nucleoid-associated protein YgaU|nr:LysM peptidoglycan-binding domain-containing protein [Jatrophihabitans sp.]
MSVAFDYAPAVTIPAPARPGAPAGAPRRLATVTVLLPPGAPACAPPLRLTRRGVVVLALAVSVLGGALVWLASLSAPAPGPAPAGPRAVTVEAGDTLWSIAARFAPQRDPRAEVAALQHRNHLTSVDLTPGQVLRVP